MTVLSRPNAVAQVLSEPWRLVATLFAPFAALIVCWFLPPDKAEWWVRVDGYFVTLFGAWQVIQGMRSNRRAFKRPTESELAADWLRRLSAAARGEKRATVALTGTVRTAVSGASAVITVTPGPNASVERRLELVEKGLEQVNKRVDEAQARLDAKVSEIERTAADERAARERADQELGARMEDIAVGSFDLNWAGAILVIVGSFFSTFPVGVGDVVLTLKPPFIA